MYDPELLVEKLRTLHGYFKVNAEQLFDICKNDIPAMIETVKTMIADIEHGVA